MAFGADVAQPTRNSAGGPAGRFVLQLHDGVTGGRGFATPRVGTGHMTPPGTLAGRSPSLTGLPAAASPSRKPAPAPAPADEDATASPAPDAGAFPGCRAVRISREEFDDYDGRVEYWDAATETAMVVCEPAGVYHEHPGQRVAHMAALIALTRGAPIETFGSADLMLRDEHGERRRVLEADQTVYLSPERDRPAGHYIVVDEDTLPDVVVEVDHNTDVRRGKLALYESWGLPEVWVEVPDAHSPSRAANREPGVTIHVLHADGCYRESAKSRAFPGWTASEIHRAMNEPTLSTETMAILERVGRALRDRDGADMGDAPFLRRLRAESHAAGRAEGRAEGRDGQRTLLCRQAARRFGAGTAERLADLIVRVEDSARLAEIGEWIVTCASGRELLDRCSHTRPS